MIQETIDCVIEINRECTGIDQYYGQCDCTPPDEDYLYSCNNPDPSWGDADEDTIPDQCDDCPNDPDNDIDQDGVC